MPEDVRGGQKGEDGCFKQDGGMHIIMEYVMLEGMERESVWEREREKGRGEVEVEVEVEEDKASTVVPQAVRHTSGRTFDMGEIKRYQWLAQYIHQRT